ncbi:hypothetical protein IVB18_14285 [Bradyrhizobium sp. 186]|uniref:hypothetical protein n=1 Tax=Bradyrhizobium sp. 186 TaxID=2782654 RepID=UPI002000DBEA|nr:hypothetical protein [Bradyrhizobium sp. 186]UPK38303.1 hypothetical protein IVB18_14285 [Bradyrhizobium sp. 186]
MSKGNPAEDGIAQTATFLGGSEAAAGVGGTTDNGGGLDEEIDEYDELLASLGRTYDEDVRIAVHESGHAVCARLLGHEVGGVTVNPDATRGYEGLCWGVSHTEAFEKGGGDASDVREALAPVMPEPGEDRRSVSDVYASVYSQCVELMAGRAAEAMLLSDRDPEPPADDLRQARELALLFCKSEQAIETFIAHCDVAARDLLLPHRDLLMALSILLRMRRTLDGTEIDKIIWDFEARKALAIEHRRRAEWRKAELAAERFRAECDHTDAAASSQSAPDRMR